MNPLVQLDPGLFVWTIITFMVLFFVLAKFAWKPLMKMLQEREEMIRGSLDDAEKAKAELEHLNEESEAIMIKARAEAQTILANGKAAAEKVKEDTIAKAKEQAKKIIKKTEKQIQFLSPPNSSHHLIPIFSFKQNNSCLTAGCPG